MAVHPSRPDESYRFAIQAMTPTGWLTVATSATRPVRFLARCTCPDTWRVRPPEPPAPDAGADLIAAYFAGLGAYPARPATTD